MQHHASQREYGILVVALEHSSSDEQDELELFETWLGASGYKVYKAASGEDSLHFLQERTPGATPGQSPVDLVILDVARLPLDGQEICHRIKSHPLGEHIPVLVVTDLATRHDPGEETAIIADDYLARPFRKVELLSRVRALLRMGAIQQELLKCNAELERLRSFKENVLQNMASSLAHDMRNPLVTLSLGIQYLEKSLGAGGHYQEVLQRLHRQIDRLSQIIDRFLDFSHPPKLKPTPCDIAAILEQVIKSLENSLTEREIQVRRDYAADAAHTPDMEMLELDAEQMERVFRLLLANAIEAMPDGGALSLRTFVASDSSTQPGKAGASQVVVQVQDTGVGISPEIIGRIFEPFFTTKPKGVGLGLTIAQQIVEGHGGRISVQSETGQGSTFTIALPRRV